MDSRKSNTTSDKAHNKSVTVVKANVSTTDMTPPTDTTPISDPVNISLANSQATASYQDGHIEDTRCMSGPIDHQDPSTPFPDRKFKSATTIPPPLHGAQTVVDPRDEPNLASNVGDFCNLGCDSSAEFQPGEFGGDDLTGRKGKKQRPAEGESGTEDSLWKTTDESSSDMDGVWEDYAGLVPIVDRTEDFMKTESEFVFMSEVESSANLSTAPVVSNSRALPPSGSVPPSLSALGISGDLFQFTNVPNKSDNAFKMAALACKKNKKGGSVSLGQISKATEGKQTLYVNYASEAGLGVEDALVRNAEEQVQGSVSSNEFKVNCIFEGQERVPGEEQYGPEMDIPILQKNPDSDSEPDYVEPIPYAVLQAQHTERMKVYMASRSDDQKKEDEEYEREKLQMVIEGSLGKPDPDDKVRLFLAQHKEQHYKTVQEAWVYPVIAKARRKIHKTKKEAEQYRRKQEALHPGSTRRIRKKLNLKKIRDRKEHAGEFELRRAVGSSSEHSGAEDFAYNPVRPDSSTSPFDLDSDDINPGEKAMFDKVAEYDRKKVKIVHKQKDGMKPSGSESEVEEPRKIYANYRTRTGIRKNIPPPAEPIPEIKISLLDDDAGYAESLKRRSKPQKGFVEEEEYKRRTPYRLYCKDIKSYDKMMGIIPNRNRKLEPAWLPKPKNVSAVKTEPFSTKGIPSFGKSDVPKLPPIKGTGNKTDDYASSISTNSLWALSNRRSSNHNSKPTPMKGIHPPWNKPPPPIWVNPGDQPKEQPSYLRMPLEDGTYQYWRPRQNPGWLFNQARCSSAGCQRIRDPEARYSCEPTMDSEPPSAYEAYLQAAEKSKNDAEMRKKNRQIEKANMIEAQRKVVELVAPTANLHIEHPNVRPGQIVLGPDDILAKVSYLQSNFGDLKHIAANLGEFKGHLIVRIVRLGPGGKFQNGLVPGVLAWARYGQGQRLKACFMADNVDFFIYQIEDLSYFYNDERDPVVVPEISAPKKH